MKGLPPVTSGTNPLPTEDVGREGGTGVSYPQFQTFKISKADVPAIMLQLSKMAGEPTDADLIDPDTADFTKSYDDREIIVVDTTHSLKPPSGSSSKAELSGLKADVAGDEGVGEDIDTSSTLDESDRMSIISTDDEPGSERFETLSVDSGIHGEPELEADDDLDDEDWDDEGELDSERFETRSKDSRLYSNTEREIDDHDENGAQGDDPDSVSSQPSIKEWFVQKTKNIRKTLSDWRVRLAEKVIRNVHHKATDSLVLHAPSPKAIKERIAGKVADASPKMQDLSRQANQEIFQLSKPGGSSEYADVDQLAAVKQRISETRQRLNELSNERANLMKAFDEENAVEELDAINHEESVLSSDLKSYKTAEKMLQGMMQPVTNRVQRDRLTAENEAYEGKTEAYKADSKMLSQNLKKLSKEYAKLKSSLKKDIQRKEHSIKQLKSDIKALEKTLKQIDKDVPSAEGNIIHVEAGVAYDYDELKSELADLRGRLQFEETVLSNIKINIKKKKAQLTSVQEEQSVLRQQMRKDKSDHQRALDVINKLSKK